MAAQQAITFDYDSTLEVVSSDNQKVGLASSGKITLNRPDKIHGTRTGGLPISFSFDGKTLNFLGKNANAYAQVDAPGTIDQLVTCCATSTTGPCRAPICCCRTSMANSSQR